jgi:hypothetical protein
MDIVRTILRPCLASFLAGFQRKLHKAGLTAVHQVTQRGVIDLTLTA